MFYYTIQKSLTNVNDLDNLRIVGFVAVYSDSAKTQKLTDLTLSTLGLDLYFTDVPHSTTTEFNTNFESLVMAEVNKQATQDKLNEIKTAKDLGLL